MPGLFRFPSSAVAGAFAGAIALGVMAASASAALAEGRYEMQEVDDGFLRLDTQTGEVSRCHEKAGGWVCEAVADERRTYEQEIARLSEENEKLREELAGERAALPTDEELDEAMGFFEKMVKRFAKVVGVMREEMEQLEEETAPDADGLNDGPNDGLSGEAEPQSQTH